MEAVEPKLNANLMTLIEKGAEFHGHLGPFLVLGVRMGLIGLREMSVPKNSGQMCATAILKLSVPFSCIVDGIQVATGCTIGNQRLKLEQSQRKVTVHFTLQNSDKGLKICVNPEIIEGLKNKLSKGATNEELAWEIAALPESRLFTIEKQ